MKSSCKKEETKHSLHQGLVEINGLYKAIRCFRQKRDGVPENQEQNADQQAYKHDADRSGQLEKLQVQVTKNGSEYEENGGKIKKFHGIALV